MALQASIQQNIGMQVSADKFLLLRTQIERSGWSKAHLVDALDWWLQNNRYPTWQVADFFAAPSPKLYPRSWYNEEVHKDPRGAAKRIESYRVAGVFLYRYADGSQLPFELTSAAKNSKA